MIIVILALIMMVIMMMLNVMTDEDYDDGDYGDDADYGDCPGRQLSDGIPLIFQSEKKAFAFA